MVVGYFLYEAIVLGYGLGAAAAIPGNLLQAAFGAPVAVLVYRQLCRFSLFSNND